MKGHSTSNPQLTTIDTKKVVVLSFISSEPQFDGRGIKIRKTSQRIFRINSCFVLSDVNISCNSCVLLSPTGLE